MKQRRTSYRMNRQPEVMNPTKAAKYQEKYGPARSMYSSSVILAEKKRKEEEAFFEWALSHGGISR